MAISQVSAALCTRVINRFINDRYKDKNSFEMAEAPQMDVNVKCVGMWRHTCEQGLCSQGFQKICKPKHVIVGNRAVQLVF